MKSPPIKRLYRLTVMNHKGQRVFRRHYQNVTRARAQETYWVKTKGRENVTLDVSDPVVFKTDWEEEG